MNLIGVAKVISTEFDAAKRLVCKILFRGKLLQGKGDLRTPLEASAYGLDSNPIEGKRAIYVKTGVDGKYYVIGYLNTKRVAETGEARLFATDADGNHKFNLWLRNDGTALIGASDNPADYTNWLTKYNETKEELDKLKETLNTLIGKWNSFCGSYAPGSSASVGTPPSLASSTVNTNTSDFSKLKHEKIKTLG